MGAHYTKVNTVYLGHYFVQLDLESYLWLLHLSITCRLTDEYVFHYRQSNARRLLPTPDYYRAHGYQIIEKSSDNETVHGSSQTPGEAAKDPTDCSEKRIRRPKPRISEPASYFTGALNK